MKQRSSWEADRSSPSKINPPHLKQSDISLPHSQASTICRYPEPEQSSLFLPGPNLWWSILILSSHLCVGLPNVLHPSRLPTITHIRGEYNIQTKFQVTSSQTMEVKKGSSQGYKTNYAPWTCPLKSPTQFMMYHNDSDGINVNFMKEIPPFSSFLYLSFDRLEYWN